MRILITPDDVRIEDIEVLDRLSAAVAPGVDVGAALRSAEAGDQVDAEHVRIDTAFIRGAARAAGLGPDWDAAFARTIEYAATKGWVHEAPEGLLAHIES